MKPKRQTIESLCKDPNYIFVGSHSFDVYPGWASRYVFKDVDGMYWAADVYMSDDDGDGDEPKDWNQVSLIVTTRYEYLK